MVWFLLLSHSFIIAMVLQLLTKYYRKKTIAGTFGFFLSIFRFSAAHNTGRRRSYDQSSGVQPSASLVMATLSTWSSIHNKTKCFLRFQLVAMRKKRKNKSQRKQEIKNNPVAQQKPLSLHAQCRRRRKEYPTNTFCEFICCWLRRYVGIH